MSVVSLPHQSSVSAVLKRRHQIRCPSAFHIFSCKKLASPPLLDTPTYTLGETAWRFWGEHPSLSPLSASALLRSPQPLEYPLEGPLLKIRCTIKPPHLCR